MITPWLKNVFLHDSVITRAAVRCIARPGPIAMLILARDESDIIAYNIDFHLRCGIENFVVTDNGSTDGTRDILGDYGRLLGKSMVILDDSEPAHRQAARVSRMIEIAKRQFRPRWIISSDADEFWYPISGRYDTEMDGRKNILNCYWRNFLPRANTPWQEFTDVGEMVGYEAQTSKSMCLARGLFGMYTGNHDARSVPHLASRSDNIRVYHYPIRSYEQFERKVVQGHLAAVKASHKGSASWHWREYYEAWEQGRLPQIYAGQGSGKRLSCDETMAKLFRGNGLGKTVTSAPSD